MKNDPKKPDLGWVDQYGNRQYDVKKDSKTPAISYITERLTIDGKPEECLSDFEGRRSVMAEEKTPQTVEVYGACDIEYHEYEAPFNYPNFTVNLGRPGTGCEYNCDGVELDAPPHGWITFTEESPIIEVTVIGSACCPPGTVLLHAEPIIRKYPRTSVKYKVNNLWGEHINYKCWQLGLTEWWREAGLSSHRFDLPECDKVTLMGWSEMMVGKRELEVGNNDGHYCFTVIRVAVKKTMKR